MSDGATDDPATASDDATVDSGDETTHDVSDEKATDPGVAYGDRARDVLGFSRWWQIAAAAGMMAAVSPYQYVWSSIEGPLARNLDIALPALGAVFSFYVVFQSLSQFPAGRWRDRRGPGALTFLAAVLAGGGYVGLSYATNVWELYVLYSLGAVGVGIVYTVAVNTAVKWFPDRTGLTTGIGTMAFAGGSALVVPYVRANATVDAYAGVLRTVGVAILVVTLVGAIVLRDPPDDWLGDDADAVDADGPSTDSDANDDVRAATDADTIDADGPTTDADGPTTDAVRTENSNDQTSLAASLRGRSFSTREMLSTWQFWLLYAMFVATAGADLVVIANVVSFAEHVGFVAVVATVAATLLPLAAGVSRLVMGELSDRFPRRHVMAASFVLAGGFRLALVGAGRLDAGVAFVALVALAMFFSSPLYVYFPAILADYYGAANSSGNYAVLYTAKVGGGVFAGTVAGFLVTAVGWNATFVVGGVLAFAAGLAALVLRPPAASGLESGTPFVAE